MFSSPHRLFVNLFNLIGLDAKLRDDGDKCMLSNAYLARHFAARADFRAIKITIFELINVVFQLNQFTGDVGGGGRCS